MFVWALGVVDYTSEAQPGKILQDALDQRGILPLVCFFMLCFVCLVSAVSGWWFCLPPFLPLLSIIESYFAEI